MTQRDALTTLATLEALLGGRPKSRRVTSNDLADIQDSREIRKAVSDTEKMIQSQFPSLSRKTTERMAEVTFGTMILLGEDYTEERATRVSTKVLEVLGQDGVEWVEEVGRATITDKFGPAYEKAKKAGVDPVAIFQADFGLSADKARETVDLVTKHLAEQDHKLKKN